MSTNQATPIFILSLPRSGSTLLQRILSSHPEVSSVAEPWLLLPFFYALEREGVYAEYSHIRTYIAIREFIDKLPNGVSDYYQAINHASSSLYDKIAGPHARYFIDKSPRYSLISRHIIRAFPDAKIIFLWRNPISILASINATWGKGHWFPYKYKVDLYAGFERLYNSFVEAKDRSLTVNYEMLVKDPESEIKKICTYLDIPYTNKLIQDVSRNVIEGYMGDPTGAKKYRHISSAPLENWKKELNTPYRRWWAKKYLMWIGTERLQTIGYQLDEIVQSMNAMPTFTKIGVADLFWALYGNAMCYFESSIVKQKIKRAMNWTSVYKHD